MKLPVEEGTASIDKDMDFLFTLTRIKGKKSRGNE